MSITKSLVTKLYIRNDKCQDPIQVFVEDVGPGQGQITINMTGDCWGHYWSHMGKDKTLGQFFCSCDALYLGRKLVHYDHHTEFDPEKTALHIKETLLENRRDGFINKVLAREFWKEIIDVGDCITYDDLGEWFSHNQVISDVLFGGDWYDVVQQRPTTEFRTMTEYIIPTIKEAFKQEHIVCNL